MKSRTKMLEISALVLVLQIGFNVGLNYRNNYNPLIPSSRFLNYAQTRRFFPQHYLRVPSSRSPASDSDQSDSEDASLEDSSYRISSDYNSPYLRKNDLKYKTVADNSASLELSSVGGRSLNNYADLYRSALYDRNQAYADLRRSYLRNRLPGFRRAHNSKKIHKKEDVESSIEAPVKDKISRRDHSEYRSANPQVEKPEESEYFHNLLALMESPNSRRDQKRRYRFQDNDDISLESLPYDKLNVDDNYEHNLRLFDEADLEESEFADPLLEDIEVPENRRVNLKKTVISRPFNYDENSNSHTSHSLPLEKHTRRKSKNDDSLAKNNRIELPYPERDGPDAYLDTVLILSSEGKPDDIAFAKPQLRNSKASKLKENDKNNRKKYEDLNIKSLSDDQVEDQTTNKLLAVQKPKTNLRSHKRVTNGKKKNKNRRDDDNLKTLPKDRFETPDDDFDNQSVLSLADVTDLNLESQKRSYNQKPRNNRRDYDDENTSVSLNDRLSPDDDNAAFDLSELLADGLNDLQVLPALLRSNGLSNLDNDKNNYKLAALDLSDKLSVEDDLLSNLSILRSLSTDNDDLESPVKINNDESPLSDRRIGDEVGIELVLTDKLGPDNKDVEELVPYHETSLQRSESILNKNDNRRDSNDAHLEISSSNRRIHDDLDLSVLSLPGVNVNQVNLKNVKPLNSNKDDNLNRRDSEHKNNINTIIAQIFGTRQDYVNNNQATLRNGDDEVNGKNSILHLEYPWNDALSSNKHGDRKLVSNREPSSRLRTYDHSIARQDDHTNQNNYELKLEYPWNGQRNSNKDDKAKAIAYRSDSHSNKYLTPYLKRRNSNRRSNYDALRVLPLKYGLRNDQISFLESLENGYETPSHQRHYSNFEDNQSLRVLSIARTNVDNETDTLPDSLEDPSYITFPLDRRPHLRLRPKNNDVKEPVYANRRANTPVEPNTVPPKSETLTTTETVTDKEINNTTISSIK